MAEIANRYRVSMEMLRFRLNDPDVRMKDWLLRIVEDSIRPQ